MIVVNVLCLKTRKLSGIQKQQKKKPICTVYTYIPLSLELKYYSCFYFFLTFCLNPVNNPLDHEISPLYYYVNSIHATVVPTGYNRLPIAN